MKPGTGVGVAPTLCSIIAMLPANLEGGFVIVAINCLAS